MGVTQMQMAYTDLGGFGSLILELLLGTDVGS